MIARHLERWLTEVERRPQVVHLLGLRQTGKTTLLEAFRQKYHPQAPCYPLSDLVTLRRYEGRPEQWVLEIEALLQKAADRPLHVFVDEVQKIPVFFQGIQGLYDQHKGKIKFWLCGSSARPMKRQRAETLAGRSLSKVLWPLAQSELLGRDSVVPLLFQPDKLLKQFSSQEPRTYENDLRRWLTQSLLPEPCLMASLQEAQDLLQSYQATYLENEIRRENLVDDIGNYERCVALAAAEDAGIVEYSSKARALGITPHTVKNYYHILEDTFVCRMLPAYSRSFRVQVRKSPKIYFADAGLARHLAGERGIPEVDSRRFGSIVESFVVNEVAKQIDYHNLPWKPAYFRTKDGLEVDLIISDDRNSVACEIKASRRLAPADWKPIKMLMEWDPTIRHGIVFSRQSAPLKLDDRIYNFPIWNL